MNPIRYIVFAAIALSGLTGCYKDKGNYKYVHLNDVTITIPDTIVVNQGAILSLSPGIGQALKEDGSVLSYQWVITIAGSMQGDSSNVILSTDRDIHARIDYPSGNYYALNLKVKDSVTGITYRKQSVLRVATDYEPGYMVLEIIGGGADISFVNTGRDTVLYRALSRANPGKSLPASAHHVFVSEVGKYTLSSGDKNFSVPASTMMAVFYDHDGYIVDYRTMQILTPYSLFFQQSPPTIVPQFFQQDGTSSPSLLTINDGLLYRSFIYKGQTLFGDVMQAPDGLGYHLAPFSANTPNTSLYFDELNHRFLTENYVSLILSGFDPTRTYAFDPNAVNGKMLFMGLGVNGNNQVALFKNDANDDCMLYNFMYGSPAYSQPVLNSPGFAGSAGYLLHQYRNQIYYSFDNMLWLYDITANFSRVVYVFVAGEQVTAMLMPDQYTVAAATWDGSEGRVYRFAMESTGDVTAGTYDKMYGGFGKVVSLSYKK